LPISQTINAHAILAILAGEKPLFSAQKSPIQSIYSQIVVSTYLLNGLERVRKPFGG
jgi:hypothetical protein